MAFKPRSPESSLHQHSGNSTPFAHLKADVPNCLEDDGVEARGLGQQIEQVVDNLHDVVLVHQPAEEGDLPHLELLRVLRLDVEDGQGGLHLADIVAPQAGEEVQDQDTELPARVLLPLLLPPPSTCERT